jgi:hypothetical protein
MAIRHDPENTSSPQELGAFPQEGLPERLVFYSPIMERRVAHYEIEPLR